MRFSLVLFVFCSALVGLAACGSDDDSTTTDNSNNNSKNDNKPIPTTPPSFDPATQAALTNAFAEAQKAVQKEAESLERAADTYHLTFDKLEGTPIRVGAWFNDTEYSWTYFFSACHNRDWIEEDDACGDPLSVTVNYIPDAVPEEQWYGAVAHYESTGFNASKERVNTLVKFNFENILAKFRGIQGIKLSTCPVSDAAEDKSSVKLYPEPGLNNSTNNVWLFTCKGGTTGYRFNVENGERISTY